VELLFANRSAPTLLSGEKEMTYQELQNIQAEARKTIENKMDSLKSTDGALVAYTVDAICAAAVKQFAANLLFQHKQHSTERVGLDANKTLVENLEREIKVLSAEEAKDLESLFA
jgi:hypothetical protein